MTMRRRRKPLLEPATLSEFDGVRYLHLGTPWVQGAMRIRKPAAIELEYVQRMLVWLLLRAESEPDAAADAWADVRALQLGLGAATITRFCHRLGIATTAVEINRSVIEACRLWFALPPDGERLQVVEADAAEFAADPRNRRSADVLCVDLYDQDAASPVLDSEDFYRDCAALLGDDGVMTVNLFGRDASFERSAERIAAAFAPGRVMCLRPTREGNTIVIALRSADWPTAEVLARRAAAVEDATGLPARKWLRMLRVLPLPAQSAQTIADGAATGAAATRRGRTDR
ncbi:spermidine synthase [Piscinibacter sakaiensis]|uniref:spermine/spermidine synthase domain-containing protein n=1 Tax=Piscinibacter sakaiensis TaxID=1547922 RepID=UPI003AAA36C5